jgi:hypothetical protein
VSEIAALGFCLALLAIVQQLVIGRGGLAHRGFHKQARFRIEIVGQMDHSTGTTGLLRGSSTEPFGPLRGGVAETVGFEPTVPFWGTLI